MTRPAGVMRRHAFRKQHSQACSVADGSMRLSSTILPEQAGANEAAPDYWTVLTQTTGAVG